MSVISDNASAFPKRAIPSGLIPIDSHNSWRAALALHHTISLYIYLLNAKTKRTEFMNIKILRETGKIRIKN